MKEPEDWRWRRQHETLDGVELTLKADRRYSDTWDHDHCEFCFAKFVPEDQIDKHRHAMPDDDNPLLTEGYTTTDQSERGADYVWICPRCLADFDDLVDWVIVTRPGSP